MHNAELLGGASGRCQPSPAWTLAPLNTRSRGPFGGPSCGA
jgi:hypothetical protein